MRKILFGVVVTLIILFTFKFCGDQKESRITLQENSALIREQVKNVGKLVVTEGHFSQVYTHKDSEEVFFGFDSEKKAIVVVNADVTIGYDLSLIEYEIDDLTKTLRIVSIPKEEIKISTDFEYYDIEDGFVNKFEVKDFNDIKETVNASLMKKMEASDLKSNAKNRLISELAKFYILTNSLGWALEYNDSSITDVETLENIKF